MTENTEGFDCYAFAYQSTKTYNHSVGLSVAFRQWRAESHCRFLHGYALKVELVFEANELDKRNWVQDFGGLKEVKKWLEDHFDHKTIVAVDDPRYEAFANLQSQGIIDMVVMPTVGCEAFAKTIYDYVADWLRKEQDPHGLSHEWQRVTLRQVIVSEHEGNSASVTFLGRA